MNTELFAHLCSSSRLLISRKKINSNIFLGYINRNNFWLRNNDCKSNLISVAKSPGPELHQKKKFTFPCLRPISVASLWLSPLGGWFYAWAQFLAPAKLLHQLVVKISILCRVILMDPTRPPVLCHHFCPTWQLVAVHWSRRQCVLPITHNSHHQRRPNYSRHFAPLLVQSSKVKCRQKQTKIPENISFVPSTYISHVSQKMTRCTTR